MQTLRENQYAFRKILGFFLVCLFLSSCVASDENGATRTAQVARNIKLATRLAEGLQDAEQAELVALTATLQANRQQTAWAERNQQATIDAEIATKQAYSVQLTAEAVKLHELIEGVRIWPALITDTFTQPAEYWPNNEESFSFGNISWRIEDGVFYWSASASQGFTYWTYPSKEIVEDFYLAVEVSHTGGSNDAEAGLVFHVNEKDYWCFLISGKGNLFIGLRIGSQWRQSLPMSSSYVNTAQPNHLAVISQSSHYFFLINGHNFISIGENDLPAGYAGLMITLWNAGDQASWQFDNFELRLPGTISTQTAPSP